MTTALRTVAAEDPLNVAADAMERHGVRQLLVVDADERLVGVLSYRALLRLVSARRREDRDALRSVRQVMDAAPLTFRPDTPLLDAIRVMIDEGVSAAPVLDGDRLVGVVSEHDVVTVAATLLDDGGDA